MGCILIFISTVGPPIEEWNPLTYVKSWPGKERHASAKFRGIGGAQDIMEMLSCSLSEFALNCCSCWHYVVLYQ